MSFSFLSRPIGTSVLLAVLFSACTEKKDAVLPAYPPTTPTTPTTPAATNADSRDYDQYTELKWSEDFDGSGALDASRWMYDLGGGGWGNQELETYTNSTDNVTRSGGNLVITALRNGSAGSYSYTSGRVLTKGRQSFQFGRIDVRAKLPKGQGIWPAIWMLGSDIDTNNWPKCGEIDLMELRGQTPTEILSTMHYGDNNGNHQMMGIDKVKLPNNESFADDFHVYTAIRSQDQIRFYLDGRPYYTFTKSGSYPYPFNNNFFVILNVAVGGNFLGNPDQTTVFPQQMVVDYVKFYQYK